MTIENEINILCAKVAFILYEEIIILKSDSNSDFVFDFYEIYLIHKDLYRIYSVDFESKDIIDNYNKIHMFNIGHLDRTNDSEEYNKTVLFLEKLQDATNKYKDLLFEKYKCEKGLLVVKANGKKENVIK